MQNNLIVGLLKLTIMRKSVLFGFIISALLLTGSCGSKSTPTPPPPPEPNLVVSLNPPENSIQPTAPQTDFSLAVTIASTMPVQGVTISVTAKKDDGSGAAPFYAPASTSTSSATNNFTITGTPTGVVCLTTVTVTSKSKPSNTWTGTYRYSRKL